MAKYRRNGAVTGRASYGCARTLERARSHSAPRSGTALSALRFARCSNTYSALNAVAGHYNNFGTKYPLPAKRAERALKARFIRCCLRALRCVACSLRRLVLPWLTPHCRVRRVQELSDAELLIARGR